MGGGRCESRNADGAVNPYFAAALALAAGLEGIKEGIDPGKAQERMYEFTEQGLQEKGIDFLPRTLQEALQAFDADPFIEEVLGKELKNEFITYKQQEWNEYHLDVSKWEIERYTNLF